jgi:hypothetical protein
MKKIILTIVLGIAFVPLFSSASSVFDPGSVYNPINVTVTQDRNTQNKQKEASLKSTYGVSNYYSCHSSINACNGTVRDLTNPDNMSSCLISVESCLERVQIAKEYSTNFQPLSDGCINDQGVIKCTCKTGYVLSSDKRSCIVPTKTNNQLCADKYGSNVFWNNGCLCNSGYQWNDQKTSCIVTPAIPVVPVKTDAQACIDNYGPHSVTYGGSCWCYKGYKWNQDKTQCISVPVEIKTEVNNPNNNLVKSTSTDSNKNVGTTTVKTEVKPKGFWAKIISWFNFK